MHMTHGGAGEYTMTFKIKFGIPFTNKTFTLHEPGKKAHAGVQMSTTQAMLDELPFKIRTRGTGHRAPQNPPPNVPVLPDNNTLNNPPLVPPVVNPPPNVAGNPPPQVVVTPPPNVDVNPPPNVVVKPPGVAKRDFMTTVAADAWVEIASNLNVGDKTNLRLLSKTAAYVGAAAIQSVKVRPADLAVTDANTQAMQHLSVNGLNSVHLTGDATGRIFTAADIARLPPSVTELNISNATLEAGAWQQLAAALPNLSSIKAHGAIVDDAAAHAIANCRNLTSLDLSGNQTIGTPGLTSIVGLPKLTTLNLSDSRIDHGGVQAIAASTSITTLNLARGDLGPLAAQVLATMGSLKNLNLEGNYLTNVGAQAIATGEAGASLVTLNLSNNLIGNLVSHRIAGMPSLRELNIQGNRLADRGAQAFSTSTSLVKLNLCDNGVGPDGARALLGSPTITDLNLADNALGDLGAAILARSRTITTLNLSNNDLQYIPTEFGTNATIATLALARNRINDPAELAELARIPTLVNLDLEGNGITDAGVAAIADSRSIKKLSLRNNQLGPLATIELARMPQLETPAL
ncbi:hypothetical protein HLB44_16005 [Aquincola sp. S2]|uniref:F-box/LRR-repeat protein 15-like leucin rich repeat domain-containing protein n=1 Tax=Pseudaquabacterium terrae TaxID=2732868 RepID=A0ABX2EIV0_9BURK|nr:hypothetical protein [Aquabacterium terrae]NRF68499.1 hypothetical protein [Aquabacterium terrae]